MGFTYERLGIKLLLVDELNDYSMHKLRLLLPSN
jgi:hypothetical protein